MTPKVKKIDRKTKKLSHSALEEKENVCLSSGPKRRKYIQQPIKAPLENTKSEDHESLLLPLEPKLNNVKTSGFWCKKLKDLEESNMKNKKCELYDFNEIDESDPFKRKKKPKRNVKLQKKRPNDHNKPVRNFNKVLEEKRKIKEFHRHSLCREQIILSKERKKLANKGENFTFSTDMPYLGITSTPAVNKHNLVGASNFLFLSPVIMEETNQCHNSINKSISFKQRITDNKNFDENSNQQTPKIETKLKKISCRRVLRSGKMLNV